MSKIKNKKIYDIALAVGGSHYPGVGGELLQKFAEAIIKEVDELNKQQSHELLGALVDIEDGDGFDSVCHNTIKRVHEYLANSSVKEHFGVK